MDALRPPPPAPELVLPDGSARSTTRTSALLGPLSPFFDQADVSEIMVNGAGRVWVDRHGDLAPTEVVVDRSALDHLVERLVGPLGHRVDRSSPVVDARLPDGSRLHVVVPPLAVDGPYVTIRRFAHRPVALTDFAAPDVIELLCGRVQARANLVVCGATSTGKTTLLNALASEIPATARIVTIEDTAELRLSHGHVVRLEARPATVDGPPPVSIRDLVRTSLRMRPDRIIVGEVRGAEALDMVQAMNTGHDGSLSTCHANGPDDALRRLEVMILTADVGLPLPAVRALVHEAIDLVVHVVRSRSGDRRVAFVGEPVTEGSPLRVLAQGSRVVASPARRLDPTDPTDPTDPAEPGDATEEAA